MQTDKMKRDIMVVKNSVLFQNIERETKFYPWKDYNFEELILENYEYMQRWIAEQNFDYKQPIPYGIVINQKNEIFVYKRWGADSKAWEKRLHNKIAIWVGGHLEREDEDLENPLQDGLLREIEEEINLSGGDIDSVQAIWYINNEQDDVNQVHIGIGYIVQVNNSNVALLDWELAAGEFMSLEQIKELLEDESFDMEYWSQLLIEPLEKYFWK